MKLLRSLLVAVSVLGFAAPGNSHGVEVVLTGGVALRSWENLRGPSAHDNWWANFVRASTIYIDSSLAKNPKARIVWIVYRPAYITRGKENQIDYISRIRETASKRKGVQLVFVDNADEAYAAINKAPRKKDPISFFVYFGHSNPHAFMLDYSNDIMAASKQWMHERDLAKRIKRSAFAPNAECWSYGCYTGMSMSRYWKEAFGVPMWGNTDSTRYQPVGRGLLPEGAGKWVQ